MSAKIEDGAGLAAPSSTPEKAGSTEVGRDDAGMILDLFAGPGGWSEGLRMLGLASHEVGIEWDDAACRTRAAAGHRTIRADVAQYPTAPFAGKVQGLIASPPCQDFSVAGKMAGRSGTKGQLIDDVPRWVDELRPEWVALEQVPPALEVWQEFRHLFIGWGYSCWTGVLNAADYGVPQTRKRAILVASRTRAASPPDPTHAREPMTGFFGSTEPWVSMADALGWPETWEAHKLMGAGMIERHGDRPPRKATEPSFTVRANGGGHACGGFVVRTGTNSMKHSRDPEDMVKYERPITEPAPTVDGKAGGAWTFHRPATTVCADPRLSPPGYRGGRRDYELDPDYDVRSGDNAIKLAVGEALVLQSFRPDYPVQGTKTKQFEQIGNAVPPVLAMHVIASLTGLNVPSEAAA